MTLGNVTMYVKSLVSELDVKEGNSYRVTSVGDDYFEIIDDEGDFYMMYKHQCKIDLKKSYLSSGNVVETRQGNLYLVVDNTLMNLNAFGFLRTDIYDEELNYDEDLLLIEYNQSYLDIVKVYKRTDYSGFDNIVRFGGLELIWEREQKPEKAMTIEEVEEALGHKITLVKEKRK